VTHGQLVMHLGVLVWNGTGRSSATVTLTYSSFDPWAIELSAGEGLTPWRFDRELLVGGVTGTTGLGDVRIEPDNDGVVFRLSNGRRSALILAPRDPIIEFLRQVYGIVPNGAEHVEIPDNVDEFENLASDGDEQFGY